MTNSTGFNAFSWAPPPTTSTPADRQQAVVNALMQQAGDTSPASSAWEGVNRLAAGLGAGVLSDPNWKLGNIFGAPQKPPAVSTGTGDLY